ncbi:MAG: methylated-DNA--[protein]-cysteine S-methyltransferase [Gammaproteobacteria bacterium]|nr:methylated-DNA--[protein]-cysteine S-methyltransferase [Gammaproteobacteria bacterium]
MSGAREQLEYDFCDTPFGECLIARTSRGICHLEFVDGDPDGALASLLARWSDAEPKPADLQATVDGIFDERAAEPTLDLRGTEFQTRVWRALRRIPWGRTSSYGEIAAQIGQPSAARAVGAAVGSNTIGVLVPCHRVIRADGASGGYRWGTNRKAALLSWEAN